MQFVKAALPELARGVSNSLLLWAQAPPPCPACAPVVHCDCPPVEPSQLKEVFHERANPVEQTALVLATFAAGVVLGYQLARGRATSWCARRAPGVQQAPEPPADRVPLVDPVPEEDIAELARRQQAAVRKRQAPARQQ